MVKTDTVFYRIGQWIWLPFLLVGFWFAKDGYREYHTLFACSFRKISGLPCPGCGGTRAFYYLFQGDIRKSFLSHPVVLYGIFAYFHFMGSYFYRHHFPKAGSEQREIHLEIYIYIAVFIILLQWLVKILRIIL
jgi:hypothetical protein